MSENTRKDIVDAASALVDALTTDAHGHEQEMALRKKATAAGAMLVGSALVDMNRTADAFERMATAFERIAAAAERGALAGLATAIHAQAGGAS